ncbi:hypothetical protein KFE25_004604 [Diacronema lutheri]|uniref:Uncharacterized protein n=1 Tax=Diacronema lutheri TaxID=2081491 RepID=A0A8J5XEV1_DIALT|nr:hypothetical protein KFE25_004604 [Diacronema lutheri]
MLSCAQLPVGECDLAKLALAPPDAALAFLIDAIRWISWRARLSDAYAPAVAGSTPTTHVRLGPAADAADDPHSRSAQCAGAYLRACVMDWPQRSSASSATLVPSAQRVSR